MPSTCAFISFRLGLTDGVSIAADAWRRCFEAQGWRTVTVAGEGPVDRIVAGLEIDAPNVPDAELLGKALADADVVVAENILTIPMNLPATRAVAAELAGRPAILHHHDPPWQRDRFADIEELPPDDPAWIHVTINAFTEQELAERGIAATTIYNGFDTAEARGDRERVRLALAVVDDEPLVLHPVRAIERKNVPGAIALVEAVGGTYWLTGRAEEDYDAKLSTVLGRARCRVLHSSVEQLGPDVTMADAYAACDLVVFPSWWEGFGNPPIEAAIHRRPAAVGRYPAAEELRALGFDWLDPADVDAVAAVLRSPPSAMLATNRAVAEEHLSLEILDQRVNALLRGAGWSP